MLDPIQSRPTENESCRRRRLPKIILTRHGHVEGIEPPHFRGRTDLPLTPLGEAQAKAVAERIAAGWSPVAVYASPMRRCLATAQAIAAALRTSCEVLAGLTDLDYGEWQGRAYSEVRGSSPSLFAAWFATPHLVRFPGGDSLQDLVARAADALRAVLARHHEAAETVVLVGHDSVNRALLLQLLDQPLSSYWRIRQDPCAIDEIDVVDGRVSVLRVNDTAHLDPLMSPR
jgi:phosphoserine phosphatase